MEQWVWIQKSGFTKCMSVTRAGEQKDARERVLENWKQPAYWIKTLQKFGFYQNCLEDFDEMLL